MDLVAVFTTTGSLDEARHMAKTLVDRRLVACAQISEIESFYRWDGAVQNAREFRLLLKTTAARRGEVEDAVRALHSYDLPAVWTVPIEVAHTTYADWVADNVEDEG